MPKPARLLTTLDDRYRSTRNAGGVLNQAKPKNQKLDITVVRVNRSGETCNARPCHNCLCMMKSVGIRKVYYSVSPTEIVCESVKDMISIQASSVTKHIARLNGVYSGDKDNPNPDKYYEQLLHKYFPPTIRRYNLDSFVRYNLSNVLPNYKIKMDGNKHIVWILDSTDNPIIQAALLP